MEEEANEREGDTVLGWTLVWPDWTVSGRLIGEDSGERTLAESVLLATDRHSQSSMKGTAMEF